MDFPRLLPAKSVPALVKRLVPIHSIFSLFAARLSLKLLLIVVGVSLIGSLVSAFIVLTLQRQQIIGHAQATATRLGNAVEASLEHAMLTNDRAMAGEIVQAIVSEEGIERIRVLDPKGVARISSTPAEIGEHFDRSQAACQACHTNGVRPDSPTTVFSSGTGQGVLLNVNLIRNQPQCAGCHDPQIEVLGLLMIEMPLTDVREQLAAGWWQIGLAELGASLVLVGLMLLALRKFVIRPVGELARGAAEIGGGNLDYQVRVTSQDELGELARTFDSMRQRLKASLAGLERRNQELSVLNEVALAASQLLDLQQILDLALDTVVNTLGLEAGCIYLLSEESGQLVRRTCRGIRQDSCQEIERLRQQASGALSEQVVRSGELIFIADMAAEDRLQGLWPDKKGRSYVNIPLKSKGAVVGTMALITYDGRPLTEREVEVLKAVGDEIGIAIDKALLLAETRSREQESTTLYQLGMQLSSSLDLDQVLEVVADSARQLLAADIGVVGLLEEGRQAMVVKAAAGARTQALRGLTVPISGETPGAALALGRPLILEEYQIDLPIPYTRDVVEAENIVSFLAVPLQRGEHPVGMVGVMMRESRHFTQNDVQLLTRLAHQVVVAVENARLYQQVRRLAILEERDRLAREMHDYLAQAVGYLNLKVSITSGLLSSHQMDQVEAGLLELKQVTKEIYTDVREAIFSLRTADSAGLGLLPTLRDYLEEYERHYGVQAELVVDEDPGGFSPEVDVQVLRIIQEALTNVRKHAKTSRAWVRLEQEDSRLRITVEDDGRGFDPARVEWAGQRYFGLQIMRERAESIGGHLELDSRPGHGTRVTIWMPFLRERRGL
jgi:nitrate/nitrite-specific signal transduction histidine kinase